MRRAFHTGLRHHDIACGAKSGNLQHIRRRRGGHMQRHLLSCAITDLARVALDVKRLRLRLIAETDSRHETETLEDEESAHGCVLAAAALNGERLLHFGFDKISEGRV